MSKRAIGLILVSIMVLTILVGCSEKSSVSNQNEQVVNIYTARHYESDKAVYDEFEKDTGIKVNVIEGKAEELIERIEREGKSTQADLFITVDGGILNTAKSRNILQSSISPKIESQVPEDFRDIDNNWIGIASRARVIVYSKERVDVNELSTYEDLTNDKWKGKLLARSSTSLYNQSLVASLIAVEGEVKAEEWTKGIVNNFAREPKGNDRDQAKDIVAGIGDVAIMNTYYIGLLANSSDAEEVKVANSVGVFFPNQETTGTHLNISGVGVVKDAKNKDNAIKFIEYITDEKAQTLISTMNFEFPVNEKAEMPDLLKSWGTFKKQDIDYGLLGEFNKEATEILNRVGWK